MISTREFAAVLALLTIGAASPALFTPPKDMHLSPLSDVMKQRLALHGVEVLQTYRGDAASGAVLASINVERQPSMGRQADEYGLRTLASMMSPPVASPRPIATQTPCAEKTCSEVYSVSFSGGRIDASKPVTMCGGRPGWFNKALIGTPPHTITIAESFVRSGDAIYTAMLTYTDKKSDSNGAEAALLTLCPPPAETSVQPGPPRQLQAPQGWVPSYLGDTPASGPSRLTGRWLQIGLRSDTIQYVTLTKLLNVPDWANAQKVSDHYRNGNQLTGAQLLEDGAVSLCQGVQGWRSSVRGKLGDGQSYVVESVYGYSNGVWYAAQYTRNAEDPEDAAARSSLQTLCPA